MDLVLLKGRLVDKVDNTKIFLGVVPRDLGIGDTFQENSRTGLMQTQRVKEINERPDGILSISCEVI